VLRLLIAVRVAISRHFSRAVSVSGGRPCKNTPESINAPKTRKNQPIKAKRKAASRKACRPFICYFCKVVRKIRRQKIL
jgi:hypothetical protein